MGGCVAARRPDDRRKARPIPGSIGELFDASGGLRAATLRAGRFWPPGSSPILSVHLGTACDRLLPDRPKAVGAAPIQSRDRLPTMKSAWVDADARALVESYAQQEVGEDLALRVYTTRLLGRDPKLVLHGGGNTSVKTRVTDLLGEETDVLCV